MIWLNYDYHVDKSIQLRLLCRRIDSITIAVSMIRLNYDYHVDK